MSTYPSLDTILKPRFPYGIQVAVLYGIVWFIDLLDASILNVALPSIAHAFGVDAPSAEWTIIGFLLALTIAIPLSGWLGDSYGLKKIFLFSQAIYTASSLACGISLTLTQLVFFRIIQGAAGGLLIPVGMTLLIHSIPPHQWSFITSRMNMITLIAPAMGPLIAGYITHTCGWRWLFLGKFPLSCICLLLSYLWVKETKLKKTVGSFDWAGFILLGLSLGALFIGLSYIGKSDFSTSIIVGLLISALLFGLLFLYRESRIKHPMISLSIFRYKLFSIGNIIQCAANTIFLGSTFITGLYLQEGLRLDIVTTGWILAAITPGMMCVLPLISRYYNRLGPLPFIIPGLILLSMSMLGLTMITTQSSVFIIAFLIFCQGAAAAVIQTPNVVAIFSEIPSTLKSDGSALYALGKQLSATIGVALSTMLLSVGMSKYGITNLIEASPNTVLPLFHSIFYILGIIPLAALLFCCMYDNKKALNFVKKRNHLETESEMGLE